MITIENTTKYALLLLVLVLNVSVFIQFVEKKYRFRFQVPSRHLSLQPERQLYLACDSQDGGTLQTAPLLD